MKRDKDKLRQRQKKFFFELLRDIVHREKI